MLSHIVSHYASNVFRFICLQCCDTVGWAAGRASGLSKLSGGVLAWFICLKRGADLHMVQLMSLPLTVSCFSKIQIGFTFLVPAHPGNPGQRAVKRVCVCVCVFRFISNIMLNTVPFSALTLLVM